MVITEARSWSTGGAHACAGAADTASSRFCGVDTAKDGSSEGTTKDGGAHRRPCLRRTAAPSRRPPAAPPASPRRPRRSPRPPPRTGPRTSPSCSLHLRTALQCATMSSRTCRACSRLHRTGQAAQAPSCAQTVLQCALLSPRFYQKFQLGQMLP